MTFGSVSYLGLVQGRRPEVQERVDQRVLVVQRRGIGGGEIVDVNTARAIPESERLLFVGAAPEPDGELVLERDPPNVRPW